jgi:hypothetical protein
MQRRAIVNREETQRYEQQQHCAIPTIIVNVERSRQRKSVFIRREKRTKPTPTAAKLVIAAAT